MTANDEKPEKIMKLRERYRANKSFSIDLDTVSMMLDDINYLLDRVIPPDDFGRIFRALEELLEATPNIIDEADDADKLCAAENEAIKAIALARKYGSAE